ncbi:hypothetical protein MVEG_11106 [Podila verticillata NRRL 6337]|uniref:Uncharacterized protein n=1 Tax=Podila verticillata NRRL 6337 TaxID=1069443 RepID=A0A086TM92_9FUNG|nr:hypothetical protein MVEG_11106 [Podila verticillata NRRL 6337]
MHGYDRRVYKRKHLVALINSNPHLESLRIDLCCNYYNDRESGLSQAIILVIVCHSPLMRLTWHVPEKHETTEFAQCLLYACHAGTIQELMVVYRYYTEPRHVKDYRCCECCWYCCRSFSHDEFARLGLDSEVTYRLLRDKLEVPMGKQEESFAFRNLLELLPNCPDLQHIEVSMACQHERDHAALLKVLASNHPRLQGLVHRDALRNVDYEHAIGRLQNLQLLYIQSISESD